jgi:hypothetical protein
MIFRWDCRVIDYNGNILIDASQDEKLISVEIDENNTIHKDLEDCKDLIYEVNKHKFMY